MSLQRSPSVMSILAPFLGIVGLMTVVAGAARGQVPTTLSRLPLVFYPAPPSFGSEARFVGARVFPDLYLFDGGLRFLVSQGSSCREVDLVFLGGNEVRPHPLGREMTGTFSDLSLPPGLRNQRAVPALCYSALYDGIDLELMGRGEKLKATWHVEAWVDPATIRWRYGGLSPQIGPDGGLQVVDPMDGRVILEESPPIAFETDEGSSIPVPCRFKVHPDRSVGFECVRRNPLRRLVIDPEIVWATFLGGSGSELAFGLDVDDRGHLFVTGYVHSRHCPEPFPLLGEGGARPLQPFYGGEIGDAYVAKIRYDVIPPEIVYCTRLGGGRSLGCAGEVSPDRPLPLNANCPPQVTPDEVAWSACRECPQALPGFIWYPRADEIPLHLLYPYPFPHPDSSGLVGIRPSGTDRGFGIAVDRRNGEVVVVGRTQSDDFPGTGSPERRNLARVRARYPAEQPASGRDAAKWPQPDSEAETQDAFIARLCADGSELIFATYFGGTNEEDAKDVAIDKDGNAYVVGHAVGSAAEVLDFTRLGGVITRPPGEGGRHDGFVLKYGPTGRLLGATWIGGSGEDFANGVDIGPDPADGTAERVYVTGTTRSPELLLSLVQNRRAEELLQPVYAGTVGAPVEAYENLGIGDVYHYGDAFLLSFATDLRTCVYGTFLDSRRLCQVASPTPEACPPLPTNEWGEKVKVDQAGNAYVIGLMGPAPLALTFVLRIRPTGHGTQDLLAVGSLLGEYRVHGYDLDLAQDRVWIAGFVQHDPAFGGALPTLGALSGDFVFDHRCDNRNLITKRFDLSKFQTGQAGSDFPSLTDGFVAALDLENLKPIFVSYLGGEGNEFLHRVRVVEDGGVVLAGIAGRPCTRTLRTNPIRQSGFWNHCEIDGKGRFGAPGTYDGSRYPCEGAAEAYLLRLR